MPLVIQRLLLVVGICLLAFAAKAQGSGGNAGDGFLLLLVLGLACYLLPTIVALTRGKANGTFGVFFVNLVLGWTVVGWFVSFIWACSGQTNGQVRREEERHRELISAMKAKD